MPPSLQHRVGGALSVAGRALVRLVLDDGFVFAGTLGALVVAWVLARPSLLGPGNAVGWMLFALVAAALVGSLCRAERTSSRTQRATGPGPDGADRPR